MGNNEQLIRDYIIRQFMYDKPEASVGDDCLLFRQGIIDSLGIFQLIGFIEEQFQIVLDPEDVVLENFESIGAIKNFLSVKLSLAQCG